MLEFERNWWINPDAKAEAIRQKFGMQPIRYFQLLNALIERPEAMEYAPVVVGALLRRRDTTAPER